MTHAQISELERQARAGNAEAETELADYYHDGAHGFRVNLKLAARWYLEAATRGNARAQATIGEMYEFGEGVPQDHKKAMEWVRKGTVQWPQSAIRVAYRYEHGFNAPLDLPKAIDWYRISAEAGYVIAQVSLGELYESAPGLQNLDEAVRWYRTAAETWTPATCDLGRLYATGKGVTLDYGEAARWYRAATNKGSSCGHYELGLLYEQGLGVPRDPIAAMELYQAIARSNDDARRRLFALFNAQNPIPSASVNVISWYREAAARGDARAQVGLGLRYEFGDGIAQNVALAYALYEMAAASSGQHSDLPNFIRLSPPGRGGVDLQTTMKLAQEMAKPGNFIAALDYFVAHPPEAVISD